MKSKIIDEKDEVEVKGFPKLQKSKPTGVIYLMSSASHGVVISTELLEEGSGANIGDLNSAIPPTNMKDFDGAILLSND